MPATSATCCTRSCACSTRPSPNAVTAVGTRTLIAAATLPATGTRTTITERDVRPDRAAHRHPARPRRGPGRPVAARGAGGRPAKPRKVPRRLRVKPPRQPRAKSRSRSAAEATRVKAPRPCRAAGHAEAARRWRSRHMLAVVSAPLVLVASGGFAYFWLARARVGRGPNVVHRDVFTAASTLKKAGLRGRQHRHRQSAPSGVVLAQTPRRGIKADEGRRSRSRSAT